MAFLRASLHKSNGFNSTKVCDGRRLPNNHPLMVGDMLLQVAINNQLLDKAFENFALLDIVAPVMMIVTIPVRMMPLG